MTESDPGTAPRTEVRESLVLLLLCLVAVTVRLLFLGYWAATPLFHAPVGDELNFHQTALALLHGESVNSFLYQPLYSFFLVLVYGLFGEDVGVVRTLQLFIGVGTTLVFYGLTYELTREAGRKSARWSGRVAGLLAALFGPMVFFEGQMLAPAITVPLVTASLWCLLAAGKRQRWWLLVVAGALAGLALMARPNLAAILPVGLLWLLWRPWSGRQRLLATGLAIAGLVLGMAPSWVHNALAGQGFIPVSSSGGHSFFLGNNPQATGRFHVPKGMKIDDTSHEAYRRSLTVLAEQAAGKRLTAAEVSSYWFGRGLDYWAEHPGAALLLTGKKLLYSVNAAEISIHHSYHFVKEIAPPLRVLLPFSVVFAFAIMGLIFAWRRFAGLGLLVGSALSYLLSLVAFYVADRYRILLVPMIIPMAAVGILELSRRFRLPTLRPSFAPLVLLLAAFALTQVPMVSDRGRAKSVAIGYNIMGKAEGERGDLAQAEKYFRRSIALAGPGRNAVARSNLATILERRGDMDGAHELFLQAAQADPEWRFARRRLAILSERAGDIAQAIRWWQELAALEAQPQKAQKEIARLRVLAERSPR